METNPQPRPTISLSSPTPLYQVREYTPADLPMIDAWRQSHGAAPVPERILPPTSLVLERDGAPVAFGVVYLADGVQGRVRLSFFEYVTTRPRLPMREMRQVIQELVLALSACALANDSSLSLGHCSPAVARESRRTGFQILAGSLCAVVKTHHP